MIGTLRELAEGYLFDPSLIDLVVWFPHLTWGEFLASLAAVLSWRWVSDRIERICWHHARRAAARSLIVAARLVRP